MRGWTNGTFRVPQSILSLQTGLTTRTISRLAKVFEAEGLIRRVQRRNRTTEYALLTCDWTERAQHLFWYDEVREKAIDAFVQQAWRHSKREDPITEASGEPQEPTDSQQPAAMKPLEAEVPEAAQPQEPWTDDDMAAVEDFLRATQDKQALVGDPSSADGLGTKAVG